MINQFELVSIKKLKPDNTISEPELTQLGHAVRRILRGEAIIVESSDESENHLELLERIEELADEIK
jgi:UDP-glucose 6-dehydrogenase